MAETASIRVGRLFGAAALWLVVVMLLGLLGVLLFADLHPPGRPNDPSPTMVEWFGVAFISFAAVSAAWVAIRLATPADRRPTPRRAVVIGLIAVAIFACAFLFMVNPAGESARLGTILLAVALSAPLVIIIHELAHAAAALAFGLKVFAIHFGRTGPAWVRTIGGIEWRYSVFVFDGAVYLAPNTPDRARLRMFIAILMGPLSHAVLFIATLPYLFGFPIVVGQPEAVRLFLAVFAGVNLFYFPLSAIPFDSRGVQNDAMILLNLIRQRSQPIAQQHLAISHLHIRSTLALQKRDFATALPLLDEALQLDPANASMMLSRSLILIETSQLDAARELLAPLLLRTDLPPLVRTAALNNIAYTDLLTGDETLLAQADLFSAEAYKLSPTSLTVASTRGAVLIVMGKPFEGVRFLRRATGMMDPTNRSSTLAFSALADAMLARAKQADEKLKMARRLVPESPAVKLVSILIAQHKNAAPHPAPTNTTVT